MTRHASFGAVVDARSRVLILGSLPGVRSLSEARYYAHPQNQFWRLTGHVVGHDLTALDHAGRLAALAAVGIGLWDVVADAERVGSLDGAIRNAVPNDLTGLLARHPAIGVVAFNGQAAARLARGIDLCGRAQVTLPSSSAAATLPFDAKAAAWEALRGWL